jgi:hypothetical protein
MPKAIDGIFPKGKYFGLANKPHDKLIIPTPIIPHFICTSVIIKDNKKGSMRIVGQANNIRSNLTP